MIDLISGVLEAVSGYLIAKLKARNALANHAAIVVVSLLFGLLFFVFFGAYEMLFPAENAAGNIWLGLVIFSLGVSCVVYVLILIDKFIKSRSKLGK